MGRRSRCEYGIDRGSDFGEPRLLSLLREHRDDSAGALTARVVDTVTAFSGPSRTDDITVVAIRVR